MCVRHSFQQHTKTSREHLASKSYFCNFLVLHNIPLAKSSSVISASEPLPLLSKPITIVRTRTPFHLLHNPGRSLSHSLDLRHVRHHASPSPQLPPWFATIHQRVSSQRHIINIISRHPLLTKTSSHRGRTLGPQGRRWVSRDQGIEKQGEKPGGSW